MLHIAAANQVRLDTPGRAYFRRKLAEGKARMEAMRYLKRRISDAVYRQLLADANTATPRARSTSTVMSPTTTATVAAGALRGEPGSRWHCGARPDIGA